MANWGECDFSSLQSMANRFRSAAQTSASERFTREVLLELANRTLAATKKRTPADTGHLRRNWMIGQVVQHGSMFEVEIFNNVHYAPFVENGHRVVINGQTVGWCEGVFMLRLSVMEIERLAPQVIGARAEAFLAALMGGK